MYKKALRTESGKKFDTNKLINDPIVQKQYQEYVSNKIIETRNSNDLVNDHKWEITKAIIKETAKEVIRYQSNQKDTQVKDESLEKLSHKQKEIRLKIAKSKNTNNISQMKNERKQIFIKYNEKRITEVKEKEIEELIKEVESAKNDAKMFKAVKALQ